MADTQIPKFTLNSTDTFRIQQDIDKIGSTATLAGSKGETAEQEKAIYDAYMDAEQTLTAAAIDPKNGILPADLQAAEQKLYDAFHATDPAHFATGDQIKAALSDFVKVAQGDGVDLHAPGAASSSHASRGDTINAYNDFVTQFSKGGMGMHDIDGQLNKLHDLVKNSSDISDADKRKLEIYLTQAGLVSGQPHQEAAWHKAMGGFAELLGHPSAS